MSDLQITSLRVRFTSDIEDIKKGVALMRGDFAKLRAESGKPLPANNPIAGIGKSATDTSRVLSVLQPQITDIVTSLQGGMPWTTVLLQQGGQVRDVAAQMGFGLKEIGGALLSLVNPATLTAAALGGLAVAWYRNDQEQQAFQAGLIKTGGYVGQTAGQLDALAEAVSNSADVSRGDAVEALTAVASSGKIAAGQFQQVAQASAAWAAATGEDVNDVVAKFEAIAKDPVAALLKLNETEHFLTQAQLERIQTLIEEGRQQDAVTEGTNIYADTLNARVPDIIANLSNISQAWSGIKKWTSEAISETGKFADYLVGVSARVTGVLGTMWKDANSKNLMGLLGYARDFQYGATLDYIKYGADKAPAASGAGAGNTVDSENEEKRQAFMKGTNRLLTQTLDLEGKIKQMRADAAEYEGITDEKLLKDREDALRAIDAKSKARGAGSLANAGRSAGLQAFVDAGAVEKAQIEAQTKVLQAQYQARTITADEYYTQLKALTEKGTDAQASALEKQIAYLQAQSAKGKDAITINKQIGELEAKLAQVRTEGAAAVKVLQEQEQGLADQRDRAVASYKASLDAQSDSLQDQMGAMVQRVGSGDREYEIQQKLNDVYNDRIRQLNQLALLKLDPNNDAKAIEREEALVEEATERRVQIVREGYERMAEAQADWSNGASAAWANYLDDAKNVAGQMEGALSNAFTGAEDAFVEFVKTGKLSFSDLADSMIGDLARIAAKRAALGFASSITGGGEYTGSLADLFGSSWGFAGGGYTGDGGKYEPAGIVHKGEGVLSQYDIAALGGPRAFLSFLGSLRGRRGYADGGLVGSSVQPMVGGGASVINATVVKGASQDSVSATRGTDGSINIEFMVKNMVRSMFGSGELDTPMAQRFNIAPTGVRRG